MWRSERRGWPEARQSPENTPQSSAKDDMKYCRNVLNILSQTFFLCFSRCRHGHRLRAFKMSHEWCETVSWRIVINGSARFARERHQRRRSTDERALSDPRTPGEDLSRIIFFYIIDATLSSPQLQRFHRRCCPIGGVGFASQGFINKFHTITNGDPSFTSTRKRCAGKHEEA